MINITWKKLSIPFVVSTQALPIPLLDPEDVARLQRILYDRYVWLILLLG